MSAQDNRQLIESLYDSFNAGDIAKVLAELSDNAKWVIPSISTIPFTGPKQGRNAVAEFFSTMSEHQEPQIFEVHGMVAEGDQVVAHGHYRWHVKTTDRSWESEFSHHFTVREGQITKFQEYTDSAAAMAAY